MPFPSFGGLDSKVVELVDYRVGGRKALRHQSLDMRLDGEGKGQGVCLFLRPQCRVAEDDATGLGGGESLFGPLGNHRSLFFGQGGVKVEHERIGVHPKLRHQERHFMDHEPGDEVNIAAQPIELGDRNGAFMLTSGEERCAELGTLLNRVAAFPGLDLRKDGDWLKAILPRETFELILLRLQPEARIALGFGRNPEIENDRLCGALSF